MRIHQPHCLSPGILPECFLAAKLPKELLSAERGDLRWLPEGAPYELSGGARVTVYKWQGFEAYGALVDLAGVYPIPGFVARNVGRIERITLLDGHAEVTIDGICYSLAPHTQVVAGDGAKYTIKGCGRMFVAVSDLKGGATCIEPL